MIHVDSILLRPNSIIDLNMQMQHLRNISNLLQKRGIMSVHASHQQIYV